MYGFREHGAYGGDRGGRNYTRNSPHYGNPNCPSFDGQQNHEYAAQHRNQWQQSQHQANHLHGSGARNYIPINTYLFGQQSGRPFSQEAAYARTPDQYSPRQERYPQDCPVNRGGLLPTPHQNMNRQRPSANIVLTPERLPHWPNHTGTFHGLNQSSPTRGFNSASKIQSNSSLEAARERRNSSLRAAEQHACRPRPRRGMNVTVSNTQLFPCPQKQNQDNRSPAQSNSLSTQASSSTIETQNRTCASASAPDKIDSTKSIGVDVVPSDTQNEHKCNVRRNLQNEQEFATGVTPHTALNQCTGKGSVQVTGPNLESSEQNDLVRQDRKDVYTCKNLNESKSVGDAQSTSLPAGKVENINQEGTIDDLMNSLPEETFNSTQVSTVKNEDSKASTVSKPESNSAVNIPLSQTLPNGQDTTTEKQSLTHDNSFNEFELEEVDVPVASKSPGIKGSSSQESDKDTVVETETVQKGLQNLRNIFKVQMSPAESSSAIGQLQDQAYDQATNSQQRADVMYSQASDDFSGFDVMMSEPEDSDDDDLLDAPSILKELTDLASQNRTPASSSIKAKPIVASCDSDPEIEPLPPAKPASVDDGFSIDTLLKEREELVANDRQLAQIEAELQEGIRQGGIRTLTVETSDGDLMPEHQQKLEKMEVAEQVIKEHHPGEVVFDATRYKKIFSFPSTLTLQSCGFKPGKSHIDQSLTTLDPVSLSEILTSDLITLCFPAISCPHEFLNWVFQLISVHDNRLVAQQSRAIIYEVLRMEEYKATEWVPNCALIKRVFVNLGANAEGLCPHETTSEKTEPVIEQAAENAEHDDEVGIENLRLIIQVIADAVHLRSTLYTTEDLITITTMLFKVSLDKRLNTFALDFDILACLSALIYAVPPEHWPDTVTSLCKIVPLITTHHHNKEHIVTLLPPTDRGQYLQRRIAYSLLHSTLRKGAIPKNVIDFKLSDLHPLLAGITIKGEDVNYYLVSSLISMLDYAVGKETLPSREKKDLLTLTNILKSKMADVRESINIIDRTLVKDQMVRLSSKWTFLMKAMGSKERRIFAYTTVSEPMPIKSVVIRDNEDSDEENTPMDE